ncbi:DUF397 domain-containing protein [Streptomyces zagrosensis]|uniref:DUF397 domain-containing protein n=1 Tax=Streptomyces zagrosensis TaxID=1042984 RepID=A0A7W9V0D9_9ACTN|nr:DUF397 domain-containing protein [Streptomyces zagrosensis]MBB5938058.1 hypothetical protein [Streptomyces zagrosensis]
MPNMELKWQKSSFSGAGGHDCVEIAKLGDRLAIRESDAPEIVMATSRSKFGALVRHVQAGALDNFAG